MQAEELKERVTDAVDDLKAQDVVVLDVRERTSMADYLVIASGNSRRHLHAIADNVVTKIKQQGQGIRPVLEGGADSDWILVDMGDVIVHVMLPAAREFYDLERLWRDAPGLGASGQE